MLGKQAKNTGKEFTQRENIYQVWEAEQGLTNTQMSMQASTWHTTQNIWLIIIHKNHIRFLSSNS